MKQDRTVTDVAAMSEEDLLWAHAIWRERYGHVFAARECEVPITPGEGLEDWYSGPAVYEHALAECERNLLLTSEDLRRRGYVLRHFDSPALKPGESLY